MDRATIAYLEQRYTALEKEIADALRQMIFAIGFAWLWFIEQKKKRMRREALQQKEIGR